MTDNNNEEPTKCLIAGGGIVGLVLALAMNKHLGIIPEIYEKAYGFADDVGAALGMYPNGLRVLRDIDPALMQAIKDAGHPYVYRRWERHDGTEIATATEDVLSSEDEDLCSIGIRRWKLQKLLYNAVVAKGIPIHFSKAVSDIEERDNDDLIKVVFKDGTSRLTELLFGVDGGNSTVRQIVANGTFDLNYTGVTCLMGMSDCPSPREGISFPSSESTHVHSVYFPTGENEQCFQIHFPIEKDDADKSNWGNLSIVDGREEFAKIASKLRLDGWHERYIEPLCRVQHAVRMGFCLLNPRLQEWVYGKNRRIILVGDAAHPPVPYIGQGAQMGVEDAGTLTVLLKNLCMKNGNLELGRFGDAMKIYERLRIPRTSKILDCAKQLGSLEESRTMSALSGLQELIIQGEVLMNDTLPVMFPGATYNYLEDVAEAIAEEQDLWEDEVHFEDLMAKGESLFDEEEYDDPIPPKTTGFIHAPPTLPIPVGHRSE
jgi:2-polyprenyl-6-methoxyphenol hydroxylase-like FAD-dependent oxidoreductase